MQVGALLGVERRGDDVRHVQDMKGGGGGRPGAAPLLPIIDPCE